MTKMSETLDRLNSLHQQPEIPGDNRPRISLAHIDVAEGLRRHRENFAKAQNKSRAQNEAAAAALSVGQSVARKNDRNAIGSITAINGSHITVDFGGTIKVVASTFLVAA